MTIPVAEQVRVSTLNLLHIQERITERVSWLIEDLNFLESDILFLQELVFETPETSQILDDIASATTLKTVSHKMQHVHNSGMLSGTAIMSSFPVIESGYFWTGTSQPAASIPYICYAVLEPKPGQAVIVFTGHLHWGGDKEYSRMVQMSDVDKMAGTLNEKYAHMSPLIVFGGDFNTLPDSESIRYMKGLSSFDGKGAFWVDGFDIAGPETPGTTVSCENLLARRTASNAGIKIPSLMPDRRIDYLLSYGWNYGKQGSPLSYQRCFDKVQEDGWPISDHYGVTVDYWVK